MADAQKVAEIYAELQLKTSQFKAALNEATGAARQFSQNMRQQSQEAKAGIALLGEEIGVRLPRHLRSFVAQLPGVSKVMAAAFNSIAVLALIDVLIKAGEKLAEWLKKNEEARKAGQEAWNGISKSVEGAVSSLELANDRLAIQIAKLEHKPANGAKLALDETVNATIALIDKLTEASHKFDEVMQKERTSAWGTFLSGKPSDTALYNQITNDRSAIEGQNAAFSGLLKQARESGDPAEVKRVMMDYYNAVNPLFSTLETHLDAAAHAQAGYQRSGDARYNSDSLNWITQARQLTQMDERGIGEQFISNEQTATVKTLQDAKANLEAVKALDNERLRADEATLRSLKEQKAQFSQTWTATDDAAFWHSHIAAYHAGSEGLKSVQEKILKDQGEIGKQFAAIRKRTIGVAPDDRPGQIETGSTAYDAALERDAAAQARLTAEWVDARDSLLLYTGALTPHEAALHAAASHTAEYKAQLQALHAQLASLQQDDQLAQALGIDDGQNHAKQLALNTQIDALSNHYHIQQLQDAQAELSTTWRGMVDGVWDGLIAKAHDTQRQLQAIALQFVDGLNSTLARGMTGGHMDFSGLFRNAAEGLAKTGLENIEGSVLKAFNLGGMTHRKGETEETALFVEVVGGGSSGSLFGGDDSDEAQSGESVLSKGLLGFLNDSNWASSLFGGRLFGSGGIFGHAASGMDYVPGGVSIDVGELGPERFVTPGPGRIVPANEVGRGGVNIAHIDARGTDPALTQLAVARAMRATHAQAVRDSMRAQADQQRRSAR